MQYSEFHFYSPLYDADVARISMPDNLGREYFCYIPSYTGTRKYRERRDEALELIEQAISQGCEPGEVVRA